MALQIAEILTDIVTDKTGHRPRLTDDYAFASAVDTTGQPVKNMPTTPNQTIWQVTADEKTVDAIDKDANYQILWCKDAEELADGI